MDRDQSKRKAAQSPIPRKTGSGPRASKIRKTNPPDTNPQQSEPQGKTQNQSQFQTQNQPQTQTQLQTPSKEKPGGSDLVKKLVAAWIGGSQGQHPLMTQESVRESIMLRDSRQQCSEAESMVQMFQEKVKAAEGVISSLKIALKAEGKEKLDLVDKMNATGQLTATISDHINYITDTLDRCQQHKNHLSQLYNSVILKQKKEYADLKSHEEQLQKQATSLQSKVVASERDLETARRADENKWNQMQRAYEAEVAQFRAEYENTRKQLEAIANEKNEVSGKLADEKKFSLELEKKIHEYENEVKNLTEQLNRVSGNLRCVNDEKIQWEAQLAEKDRNLLKIVEELDTATRKITELSAEVSTINGANSKLEEKLRCELNERDLLSKSLNARVEDLTRQVERLRESKDEAIEELERSKDEAVKEIQRSKEEAVRDMQRKIETAETETQRVLAESKIGNDELAQKYNRLLKVQVEKYESCAAELKTMEARHKCELSRTSATSGTSLANANAEKRQIERELDTMRREKERLEVQFRQTEDLLHQHIKSEKLLQKQLDEARSQATQFANAAATATAEKERVAEDKEEHVCKIKELEQQLLKFEFNSAKKTSAVETPKENSVMEVDRRGKDRAKKPTVTASTTVKKSILKRPNASKSRRTRSSPPSPVSIAPPPPPPAAEKKSITFDMDLSSDSSPVKLNNPATVKKLINSESLFDDMVSTGISSSQPMQAALTYSQTPMSQVSTGGRKFFKSRLSQSK